MLSCTMNWIFVSFWRRVYHKQNIALDKAEKHFLMVIHKNTIMMTMPNNYINRIFNELHISHLTLANTVFGYWYARKGLRKIISLITCILLMSTGMPKKYPGIAKLLWWMCSFIRNMLCIRNMYCSIVNCIHFAQCIHVIILVKSCLHRNHEDVFSVNTVGVHVYTLSVPLPRLFIAWKANVSLC